MSQEFVSLYRKKNPSWDDFDDFDPEEIREDQAYMDGYTQWSRWPPVPFDPHPAWMEPNELITFPIPQILSKHPRMELFIAAEYTRLHGVWPDKIKL